MDERTSYPPAKKVVWDPLPASSRTVARLDESRELPTVWVGDEDGLYDLIDELDGLDSAAFDTEFISQNTYQPILALVQVNTGRAIYLVDAPKLDLTEFWECLSELPTMLWYAMGEDVMIIHQSHPDIRALDNVVDVQVLVAFISGIAQVSYKKALYNLLGLELEKGEARSDWLARPLTHAQEQYAADDVRYLPVLYQAAKDALLAVDARFLDYALDDSISYARHIYADLHKDDALLYLNYIQSTHTSQDLALLQDLLVWREQVARASNRPPGLILKRSDILNILERPPKSLPALSGLGVYGSKIRHHGTEILKVVEASLARKESNRPQVSLDIHHNASLYTFLSEYNTRRALQMNLAHDILLFKPALLKWVYSRLVAGASLDKEELPPYLERWRRSILIDELLPQAHAFMQKNPHQAQADTLEDDAQ